MQSFRTAILLLACSIAWSIGHADDKDTQGKDSQAKDSQAKDSQAIDREAVDEHLDALRGPRFVERERAAGKLYVMGPKLLPVLRKELKTEFDGEVRSRIKQIIDRLSSNSLQEQLEAFLSGQDLTPEGWFEFRRWSGDSGVTRRLFVEVLRKHPEMVKATTGISRDRVMALRDLQSQFVGNPNAMLEAERADLFAMLLPVYDAQVPTDEKYDQVIWMLVQSTAGRQVLVDKSLRTGLKQLLSQWVRRVSPMWTDNAMRLGLEIDLPAIREIAVDVLERASGPNPPQALESGSRLTTAMRVMGVYGSLDGCKLVLPLLDDHRRAALDTYINQRAIRTEIADVAAATIALIHRKDFRKFGFPNVVTDSDASFRVFEVGFGSDQLDQRAAVHAKARRLVVGPEESSEKSSAESSDRPAGRDDAAKGDSSDVSASESRKPF
ncbi:MAG: hypothetical protein AAF958_11305 [Planctomycetota bacterium]